MDPRAVYEELTEGLTRPIRVSELVYAAAERAPGQLPTRAQMDAERALPQRDKAGLEIIQGEFLARVLADERTGAHLVHCMARPTEAAIELLGQFRRTGAVDLGPMRVDRDGALGIVTNQNHGCLNAEDDASTAAMEVAVDLVLLDDDIEVGVLRGAPAIHPKHAGRRIFGAGINLTALYRGQISLVEFMIARELGPVHKMFRGHPLGEPGDGDLEPRREKPWIAAVESFAIGGACQWLLVADRVISRRDAYFNLPARKEGIIPGCANLRLPRLVGERATRQAVFFNRDFAADDPEGRLIADRLVDSESEMDAAIVIDAAELRSAGPASLLANRRQLRLTQEPVDLFRRYMAGYAVEQARCLYAPALIDNLERHWNARARVA
ncbi:MAG TPA: enoyl-CoA hydratase/isomerase family protein [Solirubrobacteraceae bacterium]|nr:enoyl-CoA hydratase/isomerase family protein [Solirubrobacteraceae bacterium]